MRLFENLFVTEFKNSVRDHSKTIKPIKLKFRTRISDTHS